jgi:hypothetical protein
VLNVSGIGNGIRTGTERERGAVAGQLSSPLSTGDAGGIYEYDVAAILLSRLLRGASVPVGIHAPIVRVAFQQSNEGYPLDDVVAWGHADPPAEEPGIQVQVKRNVRATAGDSEFVKVMSQVVAACGGQPEQIVERRLLFGLAARPSQAGHLDELTELTEMARAHDRHGTFESLLREGVTGKPLRNRLAEVSDAVAAAAGAPDPGTVSPLTHQILRVLHVWQVEEGPDGRDWRAELDGLADLAAEAGTTSTGIMDRLRSLAERFGPRSGNVNADHVRDQLARFQIYLSGANTGIMRPASHVTTINASGNSTVFNAYQQQFGPVNINSRPTAPGEDNGPS